MNNQIRAYEAPYPGTPIRKGSTGNNVKYMQYLLDGIQKYLYTNLKFLKVDGIYGSGSESNVVQYQRIKGLMPDGVIGRNTWYAIEADYSALPDGKYEIYPGVVLSQGSTGVAVDNMQRAFNVLSELYTALTRQTVDGKFGQKTADATRLFQKQFGLTADERIGENTWNKVTEVYNAMEAGNPIRVTTRYPGSLLSVGSSGDSVRFVQAYMNAISANNGRFYPQIKVDGVFGQGTKGMVMAFQKYFGLKADGIVGQATWSRMLEAYNEGL